MFEGEPFSAEGMRHFVYRTGSGPKVILMHELSGLSPTILQLGKRISSEGYTVLMPMLFGSLGQSSTRKGTVQICIAREFTLFRLNRKSKISDWLRSLACKESDGRGVAAIGMCATGGLVLSMLLEDAVAAGVASQPSLPFVFPWSGKRKKENLGLPKKELKALRDAKKPLMALRFKHDPLCPAVRLENLRRTLGAETIDIPAEGDYEDVFPPIRAGAHSVLGQDHVRLCGHPTEEVFERVLAFLSCHLKTPRS